MRSITTVLLLTMLAAPAHVFAQSATAAQGTPAPASIVDSANKQAAAMAATATRESHSEKRGWMSKHSTGSGLLIGFGIGAAIGGVRCATSETCDVTPGRAALTSGIAGASIGAVIGMARSFRQ